MTPMPLPTTYYLTPTDAFLAGDGSPWPLLLVLGLGLVFLWLGRRL